jgi:hypothetical protein
MKLKCTLTLWTMVLWMILLSSTEVLAQKKKHTDSVDVTISLRKRFARNAPVDSVYIFFDRYNHTGAGIIKKVYYPKDNKVVIPSVPPGKYYIGMFCLGTHMQYFSEVTFVNKRRSNKLKFKMNRSETFVPGNYIALVQFELNRLAVTNPKSFR